MRRGGTVVYGAAEKGDGALTKEEEPSTAYGEEDDGGVGFTTMISVKTIRN